MRLIKTKQTERTTYTYTFTDTDEKGKPFIRKQTLRPGEDGVTEMDIKMLHSMDDHEVYINIKNLRPEMTDKEKVEQAAWIEWFKSDFLIKYGYEPTNDDIKAAVSERYPKNWVMSLNQFESDDDGGDTSDRHEELADPKITRQKVQRQQRVRSKACLRRLWRLLRSQDLELHKQVQKDNLAMQ